MLSIYQELVGLISQKEFKKSPFGTKLQKLELEINKVIELLNIYTN